MKDTAYCKFSTCWRQSHFLCVSLSDTTVGLAAILVSKTLKIPYQHLNIAANRRTWQEWLYVIISAKWSLIYTGIEAFKDGASSCRAQDHEAVFRGNTEGKESPDSEQTDCTADMVEQKSRKKDMSYSKVQDACRREMSPQQRNLENHLIKIRRGLAVPHLGSWRQPTEQLR